MYTDFPDVEGVVVEAQKGGAMSNVPNGKRQRQISFAFCLLLELSKILKYVNPTILHTIFPYYLIGLTLEYIRGLGFKSDDNGSYPELDLVLAEAESLGILLRKKEGYIIKYYYLEDAQEKLRKALERGNGYSISKREKAAAFAATTEAIKAYVRFMPFEAVLREIGLGKSSAPHQE